LAIDTLILKSISKKLKNIKKQIIVYKKMFESKIKDFSKTIYNEKE
jgi:hypothetical protein